MGMLYFLLFTFTDDDGFTSSVREQLINHEGYVQYVYADSLGHNTYGVGHFVRDAKYTRGTAISVIQIEYVLSTDIREAVKAARSLIYTTTWDAMSFRQRIAWVDLCFNIGHNRARGFRKTIQYLNAHDWNSAADEMLRSKWAGQVGRRAIRVSNGIRGLHGNKH